MWAVYTWATCGYRKGGCQTLEGLPVAPRGGNAGKSSTTSGNVPESGVDNAIPSSLSRHGVDLDEHFSIKSVDLSLLKPSFEMAEDGRIVEVEERGIIIFPKQRILISEVGG